MEPQETITHTVWLNDEAHIASFHPIEGYYIKTFPGHDFFIAFIQSLQEQGYRFQ
jgi:hypothetical protein